MTGTEKLTVQLGRIQVNACKEELRSVHHRTIPCHTGGPTQHDQDSKCWCLWGIPKKVGSRAGLTQIYTDCPEQPASMAKRTQSLQHY